MDMTHNPSSDQAKKLNRLANQLLRKAGCNPDGSRRGSQSVGQIIFERRTIITTPMGGQARR